MSKFVVNATYFHEGVPHIKQLVRTIECRDANNKLITESLPDLLHRAADQLQEFTEENPGEITSILVKVV